MMQQQNPFGDVYQKYWDRRYSKFSKFDQGIQTDLEGLYSVGPEAVASNTARKAGVKTIVDGFCGIGGNTIGFAKYADHVYAIEINHDRIKMAQHNLKVYGLDHKVTFIEGDYFEEVSKIKAEAVFIDPPWGGFEYVQKEKFTLHDFDPDGTKILDLAFIHFEKVIFRVPKNFDLLELQQFTKTYVVDDELFEGKVPFRTVYFFDPIE